MHGVRCSLQYVDLPAYKAVYRQVLRTGGELHPSEMYTEDNLQDVLNKKTVIMQEVGSLHGGKKSSGQALTSPLLKPGTSFQVAPSIAYILCIRAGPSAFATPTVAGCVCPR